MDQMGKDIMHNRDVEKINVVLIYKRCDLCFLYY